MPRVFDPKRVVFAVITSYPKWYHGPLRSIKHTDKVRGDLALEFFREVSKRGFRAVCSDGKSAKSFQKELQAIPNILVLKRKVPGSGRNKREALRRAVKLEGAEAIVFSEPEKVSVVTDCLDEIVAPILENKAVIVVPRREDKLFKATYPDYMYKSEIEANKIYNEALRSNGIMNDKHPDFDHFFGPRAIRNDKKTVALFMRQFTFPGQSLISGFFDPDAYSNFQYFPVVNALKQKRRVADVEVPFKYPTIQKENEEVGDRESFVNKRNMQRVSILTDLMHFLSYLHGKRSTKLKAI